MSSPQWKHSVIQLVLGVKHLFNPARYERENEMIVIVADSGLYYARG